MNLLHLSDIISAMERRSTTRYIPKSPFGDQLRALSLKRVDVTSFSKMYGKTDPEAAQDIIDLGVDGKEINWLRGDGFLNRTRRTRLESAKAYFIENIGKPISTAKQKRIKRERIRSK